MSDDRRISAQHTDQCLQGRDALGHELPHLDVGGRLGAGGHERITGEEGGDN